MILGGIFWIVKKALFRRYLHYLTYYNIGLAKEDYSLLARSNLAPKLEIVQSAESRSKRKSYKEEDLYSDGGS